MKIDYMKKPILFSLIILATSALSSFIDFDEEMVFVCDSPRVKCFYYMPCDALKNQCQGNKIFRVTLLRAKQLGKENCDCEKN
jgi:hypothetical protein